MQNDSKQEEAIKALTEIDDTSNKLQSRGYDREAIDCMQLGLLKRHEIFGPNSTEFVSQSKEVVKTCNNLALKCTRLDNHYKFQDAVDFLNFALTIAKHDQVVLTLRNLAQVYAHKGEYTKALKYLEEAKIAGQGQLGQQQQQQQQQQQNGQGNWIGPTIIHHHSKDDAAIKEEIFGPVLSVYKASSWKEAIEIENSNPFGNAACIYTSNGACADWFTERFRAAMLGVNVGIPVPREPFSFGGLYGTLSKYGDMDITGDGAIEFFSNRIKVTTKWILPKEASAGMNNGDVVDKANFAGNM